MGFGIKNVVVNTGNLPPIAGFTNARLPQRLGLNNTPGGTFNFGLQIDFELDGIAAADVAPKRSCAMQTRYTFPNIAPPAVKDILNAGFDSTDDPNSGNILRRADDIAVMDGPGPSQPMVVGNPVSYPITFEAKFRLSLEHIPSRLTVATVIYYIKLVKPTMNGVPTAEFRLLKADWATLRKATVQVSGGPVSAPQYSISGWTSKTV